MERCLLLLRSLALLLLLAAVPLAGGCTGDNSSTAAGDPGGSNPGPPPSQVGGNVQVSLTDALAADLASIYLTIDAVEIHPAGAGPEEGWVAVVPNRQVATPRTLNVLALRNGAKADLGAATVPAGSYDAMRIIFSDTPERAEATPEVPEPVQPPAANFIYLDDKRWEPLLLPGGLVHPVSMLDDIRVRDDQVTRLLLHLDLEGSVLQTVSGPWVVRPQICVGERPDLATIRGRVWEETAEGVVPLSSVIVTAQVADDDAPEGLRIVQATITSGPDDGTPGTYVLEGLAPGQVYRIVFFKHRYGVRALAAEAPAVDVYPNFDMTMAEEDFTHVDGVVWLDPFAPGASVNVRLVRNVPPQNLRVIAATQHPAPAGSGSEGPVRYDMDVPKARYDFYWSAAGYDWVRDTFTIERNTYLPPVELYGQGGEEAP